MREIAPPCGYSLDGRQDFFELHRRLPRYMVTYNGPYRTPPFRKYKPGIKLGKRRNEDKRPDLDEF